MSLPLFLSPRRVAAANELPKDCVLDHGPLGAAQALFWPHKSAESSASTVMLFIPGNPGLAGFYKPYLKAIHDKDTSERLAILAQSHLLHVPGLKSVSGAWTMHSQAESAIQAFDHLRSFYGPKVRIVLAAHSMGCWITLEVLKARGKDVTASFLLFPTIRHIVDTPNGRNLSWLFRGPGPRIISNLAYLTRFIPTKFLSLLFFDWPLSPLKILQEFVQSPPSVHAALAMSQEEMTTICDLDVALLMEHRHRICMFFADYDGWVGDNKEEILRAFPADEGTVKFAHGEAGIPHAFCINHGEIVAEQCHEWLKAIE